MSLRGFVAVDRGTHKLSLPDESQFLPPESKATAEAPERFSGRVIVKLDRLNGSLPAATRGERTQADDQQCSRGGLGHEHRSYLRRAIRKDLEVRGAR